MLLEAPSDGSMKYKSKSDKYCNAKIACNSISFLSKKSLSSNPGVSTN